MDYHDFASDLPLDRTIAFSSVEENEEAMQRDGVTQLMQQLGTGKYQANLAVRSTEQADFYADRFSKSVTMYLEPPKGMAGILFPRSSTGQFLACGQDVANDKLLVIPDGTGIDIKLPDLAGSEAIAIPTLQYQAMTEAIAPNLVRQEGLAFIEGNEAALNELRRAVISLVSLPDSCTSEEQVSNLLAATITWIADSTTQGVQLEESQINAARTRIAKLAQEYIQEHYRESIRMEDLCRDSGVGLRTLQRCFREYFDLNISQYLKAIRLDKAHRELAAADASEQSITNIALQNGFTHLGRFSVEFRERFGESPMHTLAM